MPRDRDTSDRHVERRDGRDRAETEEKRADGGTGQTRNADRRDTRDTEPRDRREERPPEGPPPEEERVSRFGSLFASAAMRWVLIIFGVLLLLFALGQAAGTDILGPILDALATQTGIWLLVALFALALIAAATRIR